MTIKVAARQSPLSQAQVQEVLDALRSYHPEALFEAHYVATYGDKDKTTSLRTLDKTDFFTREVDALLLNDQCRIAVHSAKDLPEAIPRGIEMIALTKGIDSGDTLVLRAGEQLPSEAIIATSSLRRENNVRMILQNPRFVDIRGTIGERLAKLETREIDGVVIAEAALIRLKLTHLNRIRLPGATTPLQGQLAIMGRTEDLEIRRLFASLDSRSDK